MMPIVFSRKLEGFGFVISEVYRHALTVYRSCVAELYTLWDY